MRGEPVSKEQIKILIQAKLDKIAKLHNEILKLDQEAYELRQELLKMEEKQNDQG